MAALNAALAAILLICGVLFLAAVAATAVALAVSITRSAYQAVTRALTRPDRPGERK